MATTDLILLQYLDILEKTNQQLGLWSNPYGLMVAGLSFMVAVLAIVFALILWRQGKEYQKKFDYFLSELKKNANIEFAKMKELRKLHRKLSKRFEKEIEEKSEKLTTVTGDAKEKLKKEIQEIQEIKNSLNKKPFSPFLNPAVVTDEYPLSTVPNEFVASAGLLGQTKCKKCGKYYNDTNPLDIPCVSGVVSFGNSKCPHCGNIN